ncbi:MAG: hypothetical protein C0504_11775 [Candidatus Solibacter sp.]|nr:hypothetical protein [Candidatus Solibacter sp.]
MIDMKQAVQIAKRQGAELLGTTNLSLEEVERTKYNRRDAWMITLSHPLSSVEGPFAGLGRASRDYKRFYIDMQSGELLAMKLREVAAA